jgi:hypothetical protein
MMTRGIHHASHWERVLYACARELDRVRRNYADLWDYDSDRSKLHVDLGIEAEPDYEAVLFISDEAIAIAKEHGWRFMRLGAPRIAYLGLPHHLCDGDDRYILKTVPLYERVDELIKMEDRLLGRHGEERKNPVPKDLEDADRFGWNVGDYGVYLVSQPAMVEFLRTKKWNIDLDTMTGTYFATLIVT